MLIFKQFHFQILLRLAGILLGSAACIFLWAFAHLYFSAIGAGLITILLMTRLAAYNRALNKEIFAFLTAVRSRDNAAFFEPEKYGQPFSTLFKSFNEILATNKSITVEKEAIYQLMSSILEKLPFGVIVIPQAALVDDSVRHHILFINSAAEKTLQVPQYKYWDLIKKKDPYFTENIGSLAEGGKKILEYTQESQVLLSVETQLIYFREEPVVIISFQDIRTEIEQKEMEAWNKLINALTHEILNSITPIHSLAYSIKKTLDDKGQVMDSEDLSDLRLGAATIQKRANGLMSFVSDYRHVASLPSPTIKPVNLHDFLNSFKLLMSPLAEKKGISLEVDIIRQRHTLLMDEKLIEQVLINLVTNSISALEDTPSPCITLSFFNEGEISCIKVTDNGKGIAKGNLDKIFVPFFTTRENGSGVGLTISRNIMKLHGGRIEVESTENVGSGFILKFPSRSAKENE